MENCDIFRMHILARFRFEQTLYGTKEDRKISMKEQKEKKLFCLCYCITFIFTNEKQMKWTK